MVQTDDAFDAADRLSADPPAPWLLCAYDDSRSDRGLDRLCCWARAVVCNGERVVEACQTNTRTNIADTQFVLKVHQNKTSCWRFGLCQRSKRQQSKNWLCFDEFLIWTVHQPNESMFTDIDVNDNQWHTHRYNQYSTSIRPPFDSNSTAFRLRYDHSTTYVTTVGLPVCARAAALWPK